MKDGENISGFGSFGGEGGTVVDFATARQLERSGSTCEVYETTLQRRRVFVKRLRPEFRDNPHYRAAFDKEFDLGVSLSHHSLPRYVALHDDYIVMDYVEGDTLAQLIIVLPNLRPVGGDYLSRKSRQCEPNSSFGVKD